MDLEVLTVQDKGVPNDERIILLANKEVQIGDYIITDSTYTSDGKISNKLRHMYWMPNLEIEKGDMVIIYTRKYSKNDTTSFKTKDGSMMYYFYWGLDDTIWNKEGDVAILFYAKPWQSYKVS